jgi:two-component system, sensor histidine kinase and response regulator
MSTGDHPKSARILPAADQIEKLSILLLEDDLSYQKIVTTVLASSNNPLFEVHTAEELRAAINVLSEQEFDLLIADLNVPDSSGLETFFALRAEAPEVPIMVLSAHEEDAIAIEAVQNGAQDYLNKRKVTPQALIRSVRYSVERARAEQARLRLEAVQDFTETLAHDMNVPLLGANRVLDLLLEGHAGKLTEEQSKLISVLQNSNTKLIALVNRLLEAYTYESSSEKVEFKNTDLSAALSDSIMRTKAEADERDIHINFSNENSPSVYGNAEWLSTLFFNLLENAIKFSSNGSTVEVKLWSEQDRNYVSIADQGKGLSPDKARHFRRFWQSQPGKQYVAETGFGLYICQRIARAHRAKIECNSVEGQGTTFTVMIPTSA